MVVYAGQWKVFMNNSIDTGKVNVRHGGSAVFELTTNDPFDPAMFSTLLPRVVTKLTEYLRDDRIRGLSLDPPITLLEKAKSIKEKDGSKHTTEQQLLDILDLHISSGIHVSSAGYMARQYSSVPPVTAIYDLISAICPQPATFYEGGPLPNVADKIIKHEFGTFLGWHADDFDMISTSGASLGNLTAVLAARNTQLGSTWRAGVQQSKRMVPAIAVGGDSHYSVERLAGIIGIGQDNVIRLPLNQRRQICVDAARDCLARATNEGKRVFCLIAAAGTTSVGAIDPIFALSQLAAEYEAWLHVDAAHNGAFLVSDELRNRVSDLRYADSFCLDAHKTLFVPAACTLLFYRDKHNAKSAFPTFASYVQDTNEDIISGFESGMKNFECTKRPSILNLWVAWKLYGREFFEEKLNYLVHTTFEAYRLIQEIDYFTPINVPESNILCFRFLPEGISQPDIGPLQLRIKERINNEGRYYLSKVDIDGTPALRLVVMNHKIGIGDVRSLLHQIRRIGFAEMAAPLS